MKAIPPALLALMLAACASAPKEAAPAVAVADIPDTDIYLGKLSHSDKGWKIGFLRNASNGPHYDNQPFFLPGSAAFLYVSAGENTKTDIWRYRIENAKKEMLFSTPTVSEYSPRLEPDGRYISFIQENEAGDVTRVHERRADGVGASAPVSDFEPLGYYAWLDGGDALAVYYRTEPGTLYRLDLDSGKKTVLNKAIGRGLHSDPKGEFLWFTEIIADDKGADPAFRLTRYQSSTGAMKPLFDLPAKATDFAVIFDHAGRAEGAFASNGTRIFYRPFSGKDGDKGDWAPVAMLNDTPLYNASRIAVSDDHRWIAVVQEKVR